MSIKVIVVLEFEGDDPNGPEADLIVEKLTYDTCEELRSEHGAIACWVEEVIACDEEKRNEDQDE